MLTMINHSMAVNNLYYRLWITQEFMSQMQKAMSVIQQELVANALDSVKVKRRFRMLKQLGEYQTQILDKIPALVSDDAQDFHDFLDQTNNEISVIINRNS